MFGFFKKKNKEKVYSLTDLAEEIIAESSLRFPDSEFIYDEPDNTVKSTDGNGIQTFLGNIFNQLKTMTAEERSIYIKDFFDTATRGTDNLTLDILNNALLIRVRTQAEIGNRDLMVNQMADSHEYFSVALGELLFDLTVDYGNSISTPQKDKLIELTGSGETALGLALRNVQSISDDDPWDQIEPHIWKSKYEDDYDAARLVGLYPKYPLPDEVENFIAYMPSHNVCVITDSDDVTVLQRLLEIGGELAGEARQLSVGLWMYKNGGWYPLSLDVGHPAFNIANFQKLNDIATGYSEQQHHLETMFDKNGVDIFVASVQAFQEKDGGRVSSYSVLSFDVETLLPQTEKVAIVDPSQPEESQFLGMMSWDEFSGLIGADKLKEYKSLVPVRYDFTKTLTEADFQKIRQYFAS